MSIDWLMDRVMGIVSRTFTDLLKNPDLILYVVPVFVTIQYSHAASSTFNGLFLLYSFFFLLICPCFLYTYCTNDHHCRDSSGQNLPKSTVGVFFRPPLSRWYGSVGVELTEAYGCPSSSQTRRGPLFYFSRGDFCTRLP